MNEAPNDEFKVFTSYFGNVKNILAKDPSAVLVSIAGKTPIWFNGHKLKKLAPHYSWWKEWNDKFSYNHNCTESIAWYRHKYISTVLHGIVPEELMKELEEMSNGNNVYLLCYETPQTFCHRHIVSDWLNHAGVDCREFH